MKICIVTVYDSINCGSFWQAYTLGWILKRMGHDVYYYKREIIGASSSFSFKFRKIGKMLLQGRIYNSICYLKTVRHFSRNQKSFNIIGEKNKIFDKIDCFILGSDTIWNLENKYFRDHAITYWGMKFFPRKVISYAVSAGNTPKAMITDDMLSAIRQMAAISVRDIHTYDLIADGYTGRINKVCDPTMLLSIEDYRGFVRENTNKRFIFLYLFEELTKDQVDHLKTFCKTNDLLLVNGGSYVNPKYCDDGIIPEPLSFLNHMFLADYVITDTFHGTVFSVNFKKIFVSIDRGKNKVNEFLDDMCLGNRLVCGKDDLIAKLTQAIDFELVDEHIQSIRKESIAFIKDNLMNK